MSNRKKYVSVLVSNTQLPQPLEFPNQENENGVFCDVNLVTFGCSWLLGEPTLLGGGGASRGVGGLELLVHLEKEEGLEVKSITDGQ